MPGWRGSRWGRLTEEAPLRSADLPLQGARGRIGHALAAPDALGSRQQPAVLGDVLLEVQRADDAAEELASVAELLQLLGALVFFLALLSLRLDARISGGHGLFTGHNSESAASGRAARNMSGIEVGTYR